MPSVYTTPTSWSGVRRSFPTAVRNRILKRDPVCVACQAQPSTIADHRVNHTEALDRGWTLQQYHHESNGQGLCGDCHNRKTRAEQARGRRRAAMRRKQTRRQRELEPHPGLLTPGG